MRDLTALLVGAASLVGSPTAGAQSNAPVSTRLNFSSAAGCGSAADFAARVEQRSTHIHFVQRGASDTLSVRITPRGSRLVAQITLWSGRKRLTERSIEAEQCDDALDALALVAVVTLEGRASEVRARRARPSSRPAPVPRETPTSPRETTPSTPARSEPTTPTTPSPVVTEQPPPEAPPSEPPKPKPAEPEPARPPEEEEAEPPLPPPLPPEIPQVVEREPERDEAPSGPSAPLPLYAAFGAGGFLNVGAAPSYLPGWLVYARLGLDRASMWSPQIIVSYQDAQKNDFLVPNFGGATMHLQTAELDVCPLQFGFGRFTFLPCAFGQVGVLSASGHDTLNKEEHSPLWSAAGVNTQLLFNVSILELRTSASLGSPLRRDTFRFRAPEGSDGLGPALHRVPALMFSTSISLGLSFR